MLDFDKQTWKPYLERYEMSETGLLRRIGTKKLNLPSVRKTRIFYTVLNPDKSLHRFTIKTIYSELFPQSSLVIDLPWLYSTREIVTFHNSGRAEELKNLRPCADCGRLQHNYRCTECWKLLRRKTGGIDLDCYGGICLGSRQTSGGKR